MHRMIQIRNVPDKLHRTLKSRAAQSGLSLSDYLLQHLRAAAERPTVEEVFQRIRERTPVDVGESPADAVRAERDGR